MKPSFVFNGDADGLCALQQLHLHEGLEEARLVTGPKREIRLVEEVAAGAGDAVTVLDVSFDVNRAAVERLLDAGAAVRYFDHHYAGDVPAHPRLEAFIDPSPEACTSLIVNRYLGGRHAAWALAGAFGDNLDEAAIRLANGREPSEVQELRALGIALNYNAYGESLADLHFPPAELHRRLARYEDPLDFVRHDPAFVQLSEGYRHDLTQAEMLVPYAQAGHAALYVLPDASWCRRVSGVLASTLARRSPGRAHAVVLRTSGGGWRVSVRAPLARPHGAAALCRGYASGGGREGAAGINELPAAELERFAARFIDHFR